MMSPAGYLRVWSSRERVLAALAAVLVGVLLVVRERHANRVEVEDRRLTQLELGHRLGHNEWLASLERAGREFYERQVAGARVGDVVRFEWPGPSQGNFKPSAIDRSFTIVVKRQETSPECFEVAAKFAIDRFWPTGFVPSPYEQHFLPLLVREYRAFASQEIVDNVLLESDLSGATMIARFDAPPDSAEMTVILSELQDREWTRWGWGVEVAPVAPLKLDSH